MATEFILAIDQGTTGSRVFCMDREGKQLSISYKEHRQIYPKPGWVEHDAMEIWHNIQELIREALENGGLSGKDCMAVGITNQRETAVVWDRDTGRPIHNAIVWQCRRTSERIRSMQQEGLNDTFRSRTGLLLDPYFSGTKFEWILDHVDGAANLAKNGRLLAGTMETWLIWNMTNRRSHISDYTNASRTLIYNIEKMDWDDELLDILHIPRHTLPETAPSCHRFGETLGMEVLPDGIPIHGSAGDQQAALFGQGCCLPGEAKNTYGTGCFLLINTGNERILSEKGLLTTIGCDAHGQPAYVLEGAIFIAGAAIQWLRDELRILGDAAESETLAEQTSNDEVVLVPAFVGLGAPHWNMDARGAIFGLTRDAGRPELARAALQAIALQSRDLVQIMEQETGLTMPHLRVDGGACANRYLMQFQADILGKSVHLPRNLETTVLGAALLAGIGVGFYDAEKIASYNPYDSRFDPGMAPDTVREITDRWKRAVRATMVFAE